MVKRVSAKRPRRYAKRVPGVKSGHIPRVVGRGNYWTSGTARRILSGIGGAAGGLIGGIGGAATGPVGALMGGTAGLTAGYGAAQTIGNVLGMGDYAVQYNSLVPMKMGQPVPAFGDMSNATIIRHREYIKDISIPANPALFTNDLFVINPGNAKTFPWLHKIAAHYDQYQFMGCVFNFKSTAGDTATFALGSVILATDYDTSDPAFTTKNEMEQSQYCVSGKASVDMIHPIECDPTVGFVPIKYIDHGVSAMTSFDKRCADHGNFQVATVGLPGGTSGVIGEIWVSYEVALYKPQVFDTQVLLATQGGAEHFRIPAGFTDADPLGLIAGSGPERRAGGTLGMSTGVYAGNWVLQLPVGTQPGNYISKWLWVGASTALTVAVNIDFVNADGTTPTSEVGVLNNIAGGTLSELGVPAGTTSTHQSNWTHFKILKVLDQVLQIHVQAGTMPGTPTIGDVFVSKIPDALLT